VVGSRRDDVPPLTGVYTDRASTAQGVEVELT
jgi:hypothetical protein